MNTHQYQKFLNDCMLEFVQKILSKIGTDNSQLNQLLYISYKTDHPEVILSPRIKERYPKEITIVLQYQFDNLIVKSQGFWINISFDNIKETIYVPFSSLISFIDPNNGYSLSFKLFHSNKELYTKTDQVSKESNDLLSKSDQQNNVIMLDKFRKPDRPL